MSCPGHIGPTMGEVHETRAPLRVARRVVR